MRYRIPVSLVVLVAIWAVTIRAGAVSVARQEAMTYLTEPTLIGSTIVQGPVLFIHDEVKAARGEPCTTVYLVEPMEGPVEAIASFACIPTRRPLVNKFTVRTEPNAALGFGCVLTEFQFAGETEGHGVPLPMLAHVRAVATSRTQY